MRLTQIMKRDVITVPTSTPASEAWALMRDEGVRHAVVVMRGKVVGVVSERDLGGARGGVVRRTRTVADLMSGDVVTATRRTTVAAAARDFRERHIGCLPIVEKGRLVGIVTRSDLLALLESPPAIGGRAPKRRAASEALPLLASPNADKHM